MFSSYYRFIYFHNLHLTFYNYVIENGPLTRITRLRFGYPALYSKTKAPVDNIIQAIRSLVKFNGIDPQYQFIIIRLIYVLLNNSYIAYYQN